MAKKAQDIIHFRPLGTRKRLEAYANRHGLNLSDAIRQLVSVGLGDSPTDTATQRAGVEVNRLITTAISKEMPGMLKRVELEIRRGLKNGG